MKIENHDSDRFLIRTTEHIHRVQKNMVTLCTDFRGDLKLNNEDIQILMYNVMNHDRSKFSVEQFIPYTMLTKYYDNKLTPTQFEYSSYDKVCVDNAVQHHYISENHHPEMHPRGSLGKWSKYEAYECACDLQAMAQEFGEGTCREYFECTWKPKYAKESGFFDDYNWACILVWINEAIECFEGL